MKSILCSLIGGIFFILPIGCFAQGNKLKKVDPNPYQVLNRCDKGTPVRIILKSGRIIKGKFNGGELNIWRQRFVEIKQNDTIQTIPFTEIYDVKFNYNFIQKVGHGFQNLGKGVLFPFQAALYFLAYGIEWLTHGGKVEWN